jgi:beta-galactosidase
MKIALKILLFLLFLVPFHNSMGQATHTFEIKNGQFLYDNQPIQIHSGEMHFARIPKEYWQHRLRMLKAMGLNTVATYVFWNYHETAPGIWDFKSESRNIREYIRMAQQEGLMVIVRPGPYACAEWEFGGYPWWLQKEKSLIIRSYNQPFLDSCKVYINQLVDQIRDLQITKGGPVIMVQAENEFGSYVAQRKDIPLADHKKYNKAIKQLLLEAGVEVPLFTSDGSWLFEGGSLDGVLPTANGEDNVEKLKKIVDQYNGNKGPYMVAEFYPGWLDHWAEPFPKVSTKSVVEQTEKYLSSGVSFNYYMVHGGTNFGFTTGANYDKNHDIQPDMTSYDYDAPISEAGWATEKYNALRETIGKNTKAKLAEIPKQIPVIEIPAIKLDKAVSVDALVRTISPVSGDQPLTFEALNQGHGYVLYRRHFVQPISGMLNIKGLRDYAIVYVNGEKIGELNRYYKNYACQVEIPFNATLEILVENMGRINYGSEIIHNLKGIISPVFIDDNEITGNWEMIRLPMDKAPDLSKMKDEFLPGRATLYSGIFELKETGDTFLDMRKWGKGILFVNGHNLGRYWSVGPQQTLYLPGCWLKKGKNQAVIFEQKLTERMNSLSTVKIPILEELKLQ